MTERLAIDKNKTAIVVIDLQKGIASRPTRPHANEAVIANAARLVRAFRQNCMPVYLVNVGGTPEIALKPITDEKPAPSSEPAPADWMEFVPELEQAPSDVVITKRQWGAFYGTELDLRLRRSGRDTIVLCGIATDYGVESTARFAYESGYQQIFAEDAMGSWSDEQHDTTVKYVFRRIGRVRATAEILEALETPDLE